MKGARPSHIHTWYYAHVLNLVINDVYVSQQLVFLVCLLKYLYFSMILTKG